MSGERKNYLDVLRAIAIILVVVGHVMQRISLSIPFLAPVIAIGVPLFLCISGGLMLNKMVKMSISDFFKKYTKRIIQFLCLIPICAILTNSLLYYCVGYEELSVANSIPSVSSMMHVGELPYKEVFLHALLHANGITSGALRTLQSHTWYLYLIIGMYLCNPFMGKIITRMPNIYIYFLLVLVLIIQIFLIFYPSQLMELFFNNVIFYIIGYCFVFRNWWQLSLRAHVWLAVSTIIAIIAYEIILHSNFLYVDVLRIEVRKEIIVPLITINFFILIRDYGQTICTRCVRSISINSFGIYLWHFVFLWLITIVLPVDGLSQVVSFFIYFVAGFVCPWFLTILLSKIPYIRRLVS